MFLFASDVFKINWRVAYASSRNVKTYGLLINTRYHSLKCCSMSVCTDKIYTFTNWPIQRTSTRLQQNYNDKWQSHDNFCNINKDTRAFFNIDKDCARVPQFHNIGEDTHVSTYVKLLLCVLSSTTSVRIAKVLQRHTRISASRVAKYFDIPNSLFFSWRF